MSWQKFETNPESAYYYKHIRRQRALKRVQGYLYLIESVGCFTIVCTFGILFLPRNLTAIPPILFFLVLGIFLLVTGILAIKRGHQPITNGDIASRRSTERKQLFQYAQGTIPWRFRLPATMMEVLVGLFFIAVGVIALVVTFMPVTSYGALLYIPSLAAGAYFLIDALKRAKMARQLAALSSQELANRLALGELTKGQ